MYYIRFYEFLYENYFNQKEYDSSKLNVFNETLAKINKNEAEEFNDIQDHQPSIPKLDKLSPKNKGKFMMKAR